MSTPRGLRRRLPSRPKFELTFVLTGALLLAGCAGFVNVVILAADALPATHVSGTVSRLSADLGESDIADARRVVVLLGAFAVGAMISGLLLAGQTLRPGRRYGLVTLIEAAILAGAAAVLPVSPQVGLLLAATAAGVQNAMASSYSGLIVRTTHVTGILTDLGFLAGHALRGRRVEAWRFALLGSILGAFFAGGVLGAEAWGLVGAHALWAPVAVLAMSGSAYFAWRHAVVVRASRRALRQDHAHAEHRPEQRE